MQVIGELNKIQKSIKELSNLEGIQIQLEQIQLIVDVRNSLINEREQLKELLNKQIGGIK